MDIFLISQAIICLNGLVINKNNLIGSMYNKGKNLHRIKLYGITYLIINGRKYSYGKMKTSNLLKYGYTARDNK